MNKVYVPLEDSEWEALQVAAKADFRDPREHARRIVVMALKDYDNDYSQSHRIMVEAIQELHRAREVYPSFPGNIVEATAIMVEEAGEALKVANELRWSQKNPSWMEFRKEMIQTIAMCLRVLQDCPLGEKEDA